MPEVISKTDGHVRKVDGHVRKGCCCNPCDCEAEGNAPTADFSYIQTDDDPCTITLTNESVAGNCGPITGYSWLLNGVEFSTSQNPGSIEVNDGDDITLEVTGTGGCEDSVVMEIQCEEMHICSCCNELQPDTITVILSGFSEKVPPDNCDGCSSINGTYVAVWGGGSSTCEYNFPLSIPCAGGTMDWDISIQVCANSITGDIAVTALGEFGYAWSGRIFRDDRADCRGTFIIPLTGVSGTQYCNQGTATVIV